jgi:LruC domain-containing protein
MVFLSDAVRKLMIIGFEDASREKTTCDNDFNDAVFYVSSNPASAISTDNFQTTKIGEDWDGDGINNELDAYPSDKEKAFNNYSPSATSNGRLAFEDLWPSQGDYDFNDLVVDYKYNLIANSKNLITSIEANFKVANIGGSYKNGFAVELPVSPSKIETIFGQILTKDYLKTNSNGTEAEQSKSVVFVFDYAVSKLETTIVIKFNTPISTSELGTSPFNPFIVSNSERGKEVHLPDMPPTDLGNAFLGTYDDNSNSEIGRYYKTKRNLPWALNIDGNFDFPAEKQSIDKAHPRFIDWANSGGVTDKDWYKE